jgi:hypothetical protein
MGLDYEREGSGHYFAAAAGAAGAAAGGRAGFPYEKGRNLRVSSQQIARLFSSLLRGTCCLLCLLDFNDAAVPMPLSSIFI